MADGEVTIETDLDGKGVQARRKNTTNDAHQERTDTRDHA